MDLQQFLQDKDVENFADWMARCLPSLHVHLRIKLSRFVPTQIDQQLVGIEAVLAHYVWRGNWTETKAEIARYRRDLHNALLARNQQKLLAVCAEIVRWGGDRNPNRGAMPFLRAQQDLAGYLDVSSSALLLDSADTTQLGAVERMNSMLTKVHAFVAKDGLPIYDSRVAAAIAGLLECYRQSGANADWTEVPDALSFPALMTSRTVFDLNAEAPDHGMMAYRTDVWASAKVRLGWLLRRVLEKNATLFQDEGSLPARMHAFEASLFMLGYDVACLGGNEGMAPKINVRQPAHHPQLQRRYRISEKWKSAERAGELSQTTTLANKVLFRYLGDEDELIIEYAGGRTTTYFALPLDRIESLHRFLLEGPIGLGAAQEQDAGEDRTLGNWLLLEELAASRQFASRVAAVMCQEEWLMQVATRPLRFGAPPQVVG